MKVEVCQQPHRRSISIDFEIDDYDLSRCDPSFLRGRERMSVPEALEFLMKLHHDLQRSRPPVPSYRPPRAYDYPMPAVTFPVAAMDQFRGVNKNGDIFPPLSVEEIQRHLAGVSGTGVKSNSPKDLMVFNLRPD